MHGAGGREGGMGEGVGRSRIPPSSISNDVRTSIYFNTHEFRWGEGGREGARRIS